MMIFLSGKLWGDFTLEEKIGQLLFVHFHGETANEEAKLLVSKIGVGGIVYYAWSNGLHNPDQIKKLSSSLQDLAAIPLFIAVDQEGGEITRLHNGFKQIPNNYTLGKTGDPELAKELAFTMGSQMLACGINMNFAPVIDVACNPANSHMKSRCFGSDPETVSLFGEFTLAGYKKSGVIAVLKHYPGHGDASSDSHISLPVIAKPLEELQSMELAPFKRLCFADAIMTGHLLVPSIDPLNCATLSKSLLNYLKKEIGFQGLIISDSFAMQGLLQNSKNVADAAIKALLAGCDMLLLAGKTLHPEKGSIEFHSSDIQEIHEALVNAVKTGIIPEEKINQAFEKILFLKNKCDSNP